jgi:hypothetical protein
MRVHCAKPVFGLSAIRSRTFQQRFHEYERWLVRAGYHPAVARRHLHSIAHFGVWMERQGHLSWSETSSARRSRTSDPWEHELASASEATGIRIPAQVRRGQDI